MFRSLFLSTSIFIATSTTSTANAMDWKAHLEPRIAEANAGARAERVDYHRYLVEIGQDDGESLEMHLARFFQTATLSDPATAQDIDRLKALTPLPLPDELIAFYRSVGGFEGGRAFLGLTLHSPSELLAMHDTDRLDQKIASLGIVDMIRVTWDNDRPEFEADSGEGLREREAAALNASYAVVGWRMHDDGEMFDYLYFDAAGRFGILRYHQDEFGSLYEEDLLPMLAGRSATLDLQDAVEQLLSEPSS